MTHDIRIETYDIGYGERHHVSCICDGFNETTISLREADMRAGHHLATVESDG